MPATIALPDLYAGWPFKPALNPHYELAAAASAEWVRSFPLDAKSQAVLKHSNIALLCAKAYPHFEPQHLRAACDFLTLAFIFDELSDVQDGASVQEVAGKFGDILRDPFMPGSPGQSFLVDMARSFCCRAITLTSPVTVLRLAESVGRYVESICQETKDRDSGRLRSIEEYIALRRATVGARPTFDFLLFSLNLPEKIVDHPCIEILAQGATEMIVLSNDLYSYSMERSRGLDAHNIVTVVAKEKGLDLQDAIDYIGEWYHRLSTKFVEDMKNIPSFSGSIDPLVSEYVSGLGNWVTGFLEWSFEIERYFGTEGQEVKSSRIVKLLPRISEQ